MNVVAPKVCPAYLAPDNNNSKRPMNFQGVYHNNCILTLFLFYTELLELYPLMRELISLVTMAMGESNMKEAFCPGANNIEVLTKK